jgi:hypothetical protein
LHALRASLSTLFCKMGLENLQQQLSSIAPSSALEIHAREDDHLAEAAATRMLHYYSFAWQTKAD